MPEHCRIHGIITEGGVATNIIPDKAACRFLLRMSRFRDGRDGTMEKTIMGKGLLYER